MYQKFGFQVLSNRTKTVHDTWRPRVPTFFSLCIHYCTIQRYCDVLVYLILLKEQHLMDKVQIGFIHPNFSFCY